MFKISFSCSADLTDWCCVKLHHSEVMDVGGMYLSTWNEKLVSWLCFLLMIYTGAAKKYFCLSDSK